MQTVNNSGAEICSLLFIRDFGERTPMGNAKNCSYYDHPPVADDLLGFLKAFRTATTGWAWTSAYGTVFRKNSCVQMVVLTTQPVALGFLRKMVKDVVPGMTEFAVEEYDKYNHGISYFSAEPAKFQDGVEAKIKELEKMASAAVKFRSATTTGIR